MRNEEIFIPLENELGDKMDSGHGASLLRLTEILFTVFISPCLQSQSPSRIQLLGDG